MATAVSTTRLPTGGFLMLPTIFAINGPRPYQGVWSFFVECPCCGHADRFKVKQDGGNHQRRGFKTYVVSAFRRT